MHKKVSSSHCVLGHAVTERPVLLFDLNHTNEDVFAPEPNGRVKTVDNRLVERFFLFRVPPFVPGDLDDHEVVGAMETDIIGSNIIAEN